MKYEKTLYDQRGFEYPRKNLYILDLIEARERGEAPKYSKKDHPYQKKLEEYEKDEKVLLEFAQKEAHALSRIDVSQEKIIKLQERFYRAGRMVDFYHQNEDLTYDAVLKGKICQLEVDEIPRILANEIRLTNLLAQKEEDLKNLTYGEIEEKEEEKKKKIEERQGSYERATGSLKNSFDQGLITKKAYKDQMKAEKTSLEKDLKALEFINPKTSLEEEIRSIKHHLEVDSKVELEVLEADISEERRRTPVEVERQHPLRSIFSFILPGLGQLLNGQKRKALYFFLGSLFIYLLAIPYARGFGNYQGTGISGLISLAEGGKKLDKSIIFMIEGIIALVFLVLAATIYIMSFRDVRKVEIGQMKGVRPNTRFETRKLLKTEGFPYLITAPALIIIIFIVMVPIFTTILISFTNMDPQHQNKFQRAGGSNYASIARGQGIAGQAFRHILSRTLVWTLLASSLAILLGFIFAIVLNNKRIKGVKFFRTVYLLPWAVPAFITIMFFSIMMSKNGLIANALEAMRGQAVDIKNNTFQTRLALILIQGRLGHSYIFLLTTGVIQGISSDIYEAAAIDGATGFQQTKRITLPLVIYQIGPMLINQYTFNFNNFSIIYLFNQGGPFNPSVYGNLAGSSDILISYIYKLTMENQYQAIGGAITVFVSIILIFVSYLGYRKTSAFKED